MPFSSVNEVKALTMTPYVRKEYERRIITELMNQNGHRIDEKSIIIADTAYSYVYEVFGSCQHCNYGIHIRTDSMTQTYLDVFHYFSICERLNCIA